MSTPDLTPVADPSSEPYALELVGITKRFGGVKALDGADFRARPGEVHGLIGENGAGKSTLLKILDGLYPAGSYDGTVRVNGEEIALRSPQDARALGIAIVPQETTVIETLTVAENICIERTGNRFLTSVSAARRLAGAFIERRRLPLDPSARVSTLSSSQKQLVMIARALYAEPSVLILDEPTSSLTGPETALLFELVSGLVKTGLTCIFVSHRLDEVIAICDQVSILRDGRTVTTIQRSEFDVGVMIRAMIGRRLADLFPPRTEREPGEEVLLVEGLAVADPNRPGMMKVAGIDFAVRSGEILGIGGLVGSGRSEILGAIYGREPISEGRISVEGRELVDHTPHAALLAGIGLVTEDRKRDGLLFNLHVRENVTLSYLTTLGKLTLDISREREIAQKAVTSLSIATPSVENPVGNLSGGNQQKVMLARALERRPKVLLLDEPAVGVDVGAKAEIYRLVRALADDGVAIVVVSSEASELLGLCDRFIVLRDGGITDRFDHADASEERLMAAAMAGASLAAALEDA